MDNSSHSVVDEGEILTDRIDFSELQPADFESFIFHLLDEMGFTNLLWRKGGDGNSATDSGRDLEATYWRVEPASSVEQKYWFEVKYRSGSVPRAQVQKAILDASGRSDVDHVVLVSNSTVTNPTLNWIKDFRQKHPRPAISIWQGHDLELLTRKNPRTLAQFLPSVVSLSARANAIESRLFNLFHLPSIDEIAWIWEKRNTKQFSPGVLVAAILSETAYGDLTARPWGMELEADELLEVTLFGVANIFAFVSRIAILGRGQSPLIDGMTYLVSCVLIRHGHERATDVLLNAESYFDGVDELPEDKQLRRASPVLYTLFDQLAMHCSASCSKLIHSGARSLPPFFDRYAPSRITNSNERYLLLNSKGGTCEIGVVASDCFCPLGENDAEGKLAISDVLEKLRLAESVLRRRTA